jgi:hypothetical protein
MQLTDLPNTTTPGPSPMEIARVARWLWRRNGAKPGQYQECWDRIETAVRRAQFVSSEPATQSVGTQPASQPTLKINTNNWETRSWVHTIIFKEGLGGSTP